MTAPACAGCRGRCCRTYVVPITGGDAFRLSRRLRAPVESFARFVPCRDGARRGAIRFSAGEDGHQLALAHRDTAATCVFVLELPGEQIRCGVYDDRPVVCRTYPLAVRDGEAALRDDVICEGEMVAPPELPDWRDLVAREGIAWEIYEAALEGWNASADRLADGARAEPAVFLSWLGAVYDRIAQLDVDEPVVLRDRAAAIGRELAP